MVSKEESLCSTGEEATMRSTDVVSAQGVAVPCVYGCDIKGRHGTIWAFSENV